jgi:RND family efflux transporter MFP subunit
MQVQIIRVVLTAILGISLLGCGGEPSSETEAIRPVRVMHLDDPKELLRRSWPGTTHANLEVTMAFRVGGPLIDLPVKIGQRVEKGTVLAVIDSRDYQLALDAAVARLNTANAKSDSVQAQLDQVLPAKRLAAVALEKQRRSEFQYIENLYKRKASSKQEFDAAVAAFDTAKAAIKEVDAIAGATKAELASANAQVEEAKQSKNVAALNLERSKLVSPMAGEIAVKYVENFQTLQPNQRVLRLLDDSRVKFVVDVPENLISLASTVGNVEIKLDAFPDKTFIAEVYAIGAEASSSTRTYPVTLIFDQPEDVEIRAGMSGKARAIKDSDDDTETKESDDDTKTKFVVSLPTASIFESSDGKKMVWVFDSGKSTVNKMEVTINRIGKHGIEVEGLAIDQTVVVAGVHYLSEGQKVRVLKEEVAN